MLSEDPRISVVIAARNASAYIAETLASLQRQQDIERFEVIVVDDGSTDRTPEIAMDASRRDLRFRLVCGSGRGVSSARNAGFAEASSPVTLFLDADDLLTPKALSRLVERIDASRAVAVLGGVRRISERGDPLPGADNRTLAPRSGTLLPLLRKNFVVTGGSLAIRSDAIRRVGGMDEDLTYGEDWEFWCRLAEIGDFDILEGEEVLLYRQRATGANFMKKGAAFARQMPCIDKLAARSSLRQRLGRDLDRALRSRRIDVFWSKVRTELQFGDKPRALLVALAGLALYPDSILKPRLAFRLIRSLGR
jgi:glycosyltransferase involved in cell wall biosynthesis